MNDYYWSPPESVYVREILEDNEGSVFLTGPTGCGKSELLRRIAKECGGYIQKNLRSEDTVEDFVGRMSADNGTTYFKDGVLPTAMKEGKILILDEVDACSPGILFTLQPVLNGKELNISRNAGEIVVPEDGFHVCGTGNTKGRGDSTGLYQGTNIMNEAFLDRWDIVIEMDYPPKMFEVNILMKNVDSLEPETGEKIIHTANLIRDQFKEGKVYSTLSTRKLINFSKKIDKYGFIRALKYTIIDRLEDSDKDTFLEIFQRVFGTKVHSMMK